MRRAERIIRAGVAACLSTALALGFHVAAGAPMPQAPGVLVPLAISFAVCLHLAGTAMSRWRLALGVALSQLAFHTLFALGTGSVTPAATDALGEHQHGSLELAFAASAGHHHGLSMTVGHACAAALTYVLLRRADVLLAFAARLVAWLSQRLGLNPRPLAVVARPRAWIARHLAAPRRIVTSPRLMRGPPSLSV